MDFTEDEIQIGKQVLHSDDLKFTHSYKGEQFTLRYADPNLESVIQSEIARRLGGAPRASYSPEYLAKLEAFVTVDLVYDIDNCPAWFSGGPFSCLDEELVQKLYRSYLQFRTKFREKLRKGGFAKTGESKRS